MITIDEAMDRYVSTSLDEVADIPQDRAGEFFAIATVGLLSIRTMGDSDEVTCVTLLGHLIYGYLMGVRDSVPIPDAFKE